MKSVLAFLAFTAAACALGACATPMAKLQSTVVERAAFDLNCPAASLDAKQLGDQVVIGRTVDTPGVERTVFGVSGCGTRATYVVECAAPSGCQALMNSDQERNGVLGGVVGGAPAAQLAQQPAQEPEHTVDQGEQPQ